MLIWLFLPYSIAFIDNLTDLKRFSRISKDYKDFQVFDEILWVSKDFKRISMILRNFEDCSGILNDFKA